MEKTLPIGSPANEKEPCRNHTNKNNTRLTSLALKRGFDLIAGITGIIVTSPLFIISYIAIRLQDGQAAIYSQERIGRRGKPFRIYKFRSMIPEAEEDGAMLCAQDDDRLTPVGRFMRAHHLDELPQLWNVILGNMSFVGYRPERKIYIDKIIAINPDYEKLYILRPGIFSRATLYNGYTDTMDKMLRRLDMDLDYLANRSLWFDIKIIGLTVLSIVSGKKF